MVADTSENGDQKTPDDILMESLLPVTFNPDMTGIMKQAEEFQQEVNQLSVSATKNSIAELHAVSTPAVELALATLAESIKLKEDFSEFFQTKAS